MRAAVRVDGRIPRRQSTRAARLPLLIWLLVAWMLLVHAAYYWYLLQAYAPALLDALHTRWP